MSEKTGHTHDGITPGTPAAADTAAAGASTGAGARDAAASPRTAAAGPGAAAATAGPAAGQASGRARATASDAKPRLFSSPVHLADLLSPRVLLIFSTAVLIVYGLVMAYSVRSVTSVSDSAANLSLAGQFVAVFKQLGPQLVLMAVFIVLAMAISRINLEFLLHPAVVYALWALTLVVMLLTAFKGGTAFGATRWLTLGPITLQPSEFAKITVVLLASRAMYERFKLGRCDWKTVSFLHLGPVVLLLLSIYLQQDMGTIAIVALTLFLMLFMCGYPLKRLLLIVLILVLAGAVLIFVERYRISRLSAWLGDVFSDDSLSSGEGYQLKHSLYALGSGGFFGTGLGSSRLKYGYLTQAYNDFIFAIIGEELGFLFGTLPVILLFVLFGYAGFRIAAKATDLRGQLLAGGMTSLILIQAFINIGGVIKLIPETGRTLPFISSGNSSLLTSVIMVGFILAVDSKLSWHKHEEIARKARSGFSVIGGGPEEAALGAGLVAGAGPGAAARTDAAGWAGSAGTAGAAGPAGAAGGAGRQPRAAGARQPRGSTTAQAGRSVPAQTSGLDFETRRSAGRRARSVQPDTVGPVQPAAAPRRSPASRPGIDARPRPVVLQGGVQPASAPLRQGTPRTAAASIRRTHDTAPTSTARQGRSAVPGTGQRLTNTIVEQDRRDQDRQDQNRNRSRRSDEADRNGATAANPSASAARRGYRQDGQTGLSEHSGAGGQNRQRGRTRQDRREP